MINGMAARTDLSFEDWIGHAFAHEVRFQRLEWHWDDDCDYWHPVSGQAVEYLTRLFEGAPEHLKWFSDAQIAQGLHYLVDCSVGMHPDLADQRVPASDRERLWRAVATFFRDFLMPRCEPILGHLSEAGSPLNSRAYMWWEGFPATSAHARLGRLSGSGVARPWPLGATRAWRLTGGGDPRYLYRAGRRTP
jgi:hypothetical protein